MRILAALVGAALLGTGNASATQEPARVVGSAPALADFNGDGLWDWAAGAPGRTVEGVIGAGAVLVSYGGAHEKELWAQDRTPLLDPLESDDEFGSTLAVGDFDNDGFSDLAIAHPSEDVGDTVDAGAVTVLFGDSNGLTPEGALMLTYQTGDQSPAEFDRFGSALAAGDFDGDSHTDLAVGVPYRDVNGHEDAGSVVVFPGVGLRTRDTIAIRPAIWNKDGPEVPGQAGRLELFGGALAASDFGRTAHEDLAVGAPLDSVGGKTFAGSLFILYGSALGLGSEHVQRLTEDDLGASTAGRFHEFSAALASGNLFGTAHAELLVGAPGAPSRGVKQAGVAYLIPGLATGLAGNKSRRLRQAVRAAGGPEPWDRFGVALQAIPATGTNPSRFVVGVPYEDVGGRVDAGVVHFFELASDGHFSLVATADARDMGARLRRGSRLGFSVGAISRCDRGAVLGLGSPGSPPPFSAKVGKLHRLCWREKPTYFGHLKLKPRGPGDGFGHAVAP